MHLCVCVFVCERIVYVSILYLHYSHYHVVVVLLRSGTSLTDNGLSRPDTNYPTFRSLTSNDQDPATCPNPILGSPLVYIAAEFGDDLFPTDGQFTVGDPTAPNDQMDDYKNDPLCYSSTYSFFLRAYPITEVRVYPQPLLVFR